MRKTILVSTLCLAAATGTSGAPVLTAAHNAVAPPAASVPSRAAAPAQPGGEAAPAANPLAPEEQRRLSAQVLLDRAHFSPGSIDGADGSNLRAAADAYRAAHKIAPGGDIVAPLIAADPAPVLTRYTITAEDVAGPFVEVPHDFAAMAKLKATSYASTLEELGERFHTDPALLKRLNPGADFARAGTEIDVPLVANDKLGVRVVRIEVDKTHQQVRAFGADGALAAVFPATVGSTERPAPKGSWKVVGVAPHPTYTYDPKRLTFGKKREGKLTIAAGPNNPVGAAWIALSKPTYGIHGTPDPELVGKRASHGCVRLTNWDAAQLGAAVKAGTKVVFVGREQRG